MSNDIRKFMNLMEAPEGLERDNTGRMSHPDISYEVGTEKVIAKLQSYNSQSYTKLAQKLQRIKQLSDEVDTLKEEIKAETKESVADLFAADDAARTRIVETVSFIFQMSKDPKATQTPKYKDILEELSKSMTPELISVMEGLKKTMVTTVQKSASLKVTAKEGINEGVMDALKGFLASFRAKVQAWGTKYDGKLAALKAQANMSESEEGFDDNEEQVNEISDEVADRAYARRLDRHTSMKDTAAKTARTAANRPGDAHAKDEADHFANNLKTTGSKLNKNAQLSQGRQLNKMSKMDQHNTPHGKDAHDADAYNAAKAKADKFRDHKSVHEEELDEYAQGGANSNPEAFINIITMAVQHGRMHQAEMELDDFKATFPADAEKFISSPVGQEIQAALAESVVEGIDYGRVDRIEKQVDFMAGRGRSREEIVANISTKMGADEGEHAATYFDAVHGVSEDAVRAGKYDPMTRQETRPGKDDPEGRTALAKDVKDQRSRAQQAVKDGNASHVWKKGMASGQGNHELNRKYQKDHSYESPWTTAKRVKETMDEMDVSESDLDSSEDRLMREYEEMMETMAFRVGQIVYCGSRAGRVIGDVPNVPDAIMVELPNGEQDAFKKKDCTDKKPGLLKKAAHWMVGEDKGELELAGDDAHAANKPDADGKLWIHSYKQWIDHSKYFAGAKPSLSGHEITAYDKTGNRKMAGIWDLQGRKGWIDTNLYAKYKMKEDEMEADGDESGLTEWNDDRHDDARSDAADEARAHAEEEALRTTEWNSGEYDVDVPFTTLESLVKFIQLDFSSEKLTSMDDVAELFGNTWEAVSAAKAIIVRGDGSYCYKGDDGNFNSIDGLPQVLQDKLDQFVEKSKDDAIDAYNNQEPDFDDAGRGYGGF